MDKKPQNIVIFEASAMSLEEAGIASSLLLDLLSDIRRQIEISDAKNQSTHNSNKLK